MFFHKDCSEGLAGAAQLLTSGEVDKDRNPLRVELAFVSFSVRTQSVKT